MSFLNPVKLSVGQHITFTAEFHKYNKKLMKELPELAQLATFNSKFEILEIKESEVEDEVTEDVFHQVQGVIAVKHVATGKVFKITEELEENWSFLTSHYPDTYSVVNQFNDVI